MPSKKRVQILMTLGILISAFQVLSSNSQALESLQLDSSYQIQTSENFIYDKYVIISDEALNKDINLLKFENVEGSFPQPAEKYDRRKHFGGWIRPSNDQSCLDTRGLVLQRDSKKSVQVAACRVKGGDWFDPYTDKNYISSADIQIDHVVALKHAYMTGAFDWSAKKRCQYANYMGNNFHLMSVNGSENMKKGDRGPHEYIPPNQKFTCQYIKNWLEIKYVWNLRLTPTESLKVSEIIKKENCDVKDFQISYASVLEQKKIIKQTENICVGAALIAF